MAFAGVRYIPKADTGTVTSGTVNMGCIPSRPGSYTSDGENECEDTGDIGRCPHDVHMWRSSPPSESLCTTDTARSRSRLLPPTGDGDSERDVRSDDVVEAGMVLKERYDPEVSVAVVNVELAVPGRDPGRGFGRKCRSSSSDISPHPVPERANGPGSGFRCMHLDVLPPSDESSESSSDVSIYDSLSPEGRGTKDSPAPTMRGYEGVRGELEVVSVLPLVIKLGVESSLPSHSLCGGTPSMVTSCAFNRRNIGTDDLEPRIEPERPPEDARVVRSYTTGDEGTRVLWLPWVIVQMLVEVLSVRVLSILTTLPLNMPLGL